MTARELAVAYSRSDTDPIRVGDYVRLSSFEIDFLEHSASAEKTSVAQVVGRLVRRAMRSPVAV